jgi:hypothetical protein
VPGAAGRRGGHEATQEELQMPESRLRKKSAFTPPAAKSSGPKVNSRFFAPIMVTLLVLGLAWIVVFYITEQKFPVPNIGTWNLAIGFGILLTGFGMTTRWR